MYQVKQQTNLAISKDGHFDLKYEIYTGLEIICVLHLKEGSYFKIQEKYFKQKKNLILQHAPALFYSWHYTGLL